MKQCNQIFYPLQRSSLLKLSKLSHIVPGKKPFKFVFSGTGGPMRQQEIKFIFDPKIQQLVAILDRPHNLTNT